MDDHTGALLEHIEDQLKAILEGQDAMSSLPPDIAELKADMAVVKADIQVIKAAVTDQSRELNAHTDTLQDHETRISGLEQAAA